MLGLAPLAAKVAFSESLISNLSSAYDHRFGNSVGRIDKLDLKYWGRMSLDDAVALELETFRKEIPVLYQSDFTLMQLLLKAPWTGVRVQNLHVPVVYEPEGPLASAAASVLSKLPDALTRGLARSRIRLASQLSPSVPLEN